MTPLETARRPSERTRVAIIGTGSMGQRHARVFASLRDRFELVGLVDVRADVAERTAEAHGTRVLRDEAMAIAWADLVVVATPIAAHAGAVQAALTAGRDVLVEKPLAASAAEAHALVALAARVGRQLFVGHSERFNPVVRALARQVRGEPVVALDFRRTGPTAARAAADVGVLVNLGVHDLDLAAYLGGAAIELREAAGRAKWAGALEDVAHVLVSSPSGGTGHVYVDRTASARERRVAVTTSSWCYEGDLLALRLSRTSRATGAKTDVPLRLEEPLVGQALAIADALEGGPPREVATGLDGARALELAERAATHIAAAAAAQSASPSP